MKTERNDFVWKGSRLARHYLEEVRGGVPFAREHLRTILQLIARAKIRVKNVLDLGCGDGILTAAIIEKFPGARAVALDFSKPMLLSARQRLSSLEARMHFVEADYGKPAWKMRASKFGSYQVVVSGLSIHHQPDSRKREVYAEIFELLSPGGIFLNLEHVSSPTPWVERVHEETFVDSLWRWSRERGLKQTKASFWQKFRNRADKKANILAPVEEQCEWLRRIGYTDVDCYFKFFEVALFGGRKPVAWRERKARAARPRPAFHRSRGGAK